MREIKSVVRRCTAREKTGSVESTMGIFRSEQKVCLNVGGGSKGNDWVSKSNLIFEIKCFGNLKKRKKNVMSNI